MNQYRVGIIGATGMVGQRFISLLKDHPWFKVTCLAASGRSAGKTYSEAVGERWAFDWPILDYAKDITVVDASDVGEVAAKVDFVFCAVDMKKDEIRALEENYAKHEVPVVSNNSACRGIEDVPMVVPEINASHLDVIATQRKRLGSKYGFIAVKPNCSIQSYVPALTPLLDFEPTSALTRRSAERERPLRPGLRWWTTSSPISEARTKRASRNPSNCGGTWRIRETGRSS